MICYYLQKPTSEFAGITTAACYHGLQLQTDGGQSQQLSQQSVVSVAVCLSFKLLYRDMPLRKPKKNIRN
jgi:hypothetical protein